MRTDHRSGALAIEIKIAYVEAFASLLQLLRILRINSARQPKFRAIRDFQRVIEIASLNDRENRPKNLFLSDPRFRINVRNHRCLYEITVARGAVAADEHASLFLSHIDVSEYSLERGLARHRAHVIFRIFARSHSDFLRAINHLLHKRVVNFFRNDRARARGTLLPLIAERSLCNTLDGGIDVGFLIHNHRVLAAHFQNRALDPDLTRRLLACRLADDQAHFFRASERDEARLRIFDQRVADDLARARDQIQSALRYASFIQYLDHLRGDDRHFFRRLEHHRVACHQSGNRHPGRDSGRKIPGRNGGTDAERNVHHEVFLALHRRYRLGSGEAQHFARVEFQKIDRFGSVAVGFSPRLADLVANPR